MEHNYGGIVDAPWYVRNSDLHRDLNIESVIDIIKKMAQNHEWGLHNHPNTEAIQLLNYTATQQDQAIGTALVRVVIRVKSRA
jgi:hypothetical protein